jgi:hypothetical protein
MNELIVDINRWNNKDKFDGMTGFYVMAFVPDLGHKAVDIAMLTRGSLLKWLSKYGKMNEVHINILLHVLEYQQAHRDEFVRIWSES